MAYIQKNSPFKQTALENLRNIPGLSETKPKAETVTIGKRPKRSLKKAYDVALEKGYRKKSESFEDYSKRAKADPLYGKSGSKGFKVTAAGNDVVSPYKPGTKVSTLKDKEAKEYAAKTKKRNEEASKIRKNTKVAEVQKTKTNVQKTDTKKKETKVQKTATPPAVKAPKKPRNRSNKTAMRKYEKQMRAYKRKTKDAASTGDQPKTKVKARRRTAKGSRAATLRR